MPRLAKPLETKESVTSEVAAEPNATNLQLRLRRQVSELTEQERFEEAAETIRAIQFVTQYSQPV